MVALCAFPQAGCCFALQTWLLRRALAAALWAWAAGGSSLAAGTGALYLFCSSPAVAGAHHVTVLQKEKQYEERRRTIYVAHTSFCIAAFHRVPCPAYAPLFLQPVRATLADAWTGCARCAGDTPPAAPAGSCYCSGLNAIWRACLSMVNAYGASRYAAIVLALLCYIRHNSRMVSRYVAIAAGSADRWFKRCCCPSPAARCATYTFCRLPASRCVARMATTSCLLDRAVALLRARVAPSPYPSADMRLPLRGMAAVTLPPRGLHSPRPATRTPALRTQKAYAAKGGAARPPASRHYMHRTLPAFLYCRSMSWLRAAARLPAPATAHAAFAWW